VEYARATDRGLLNQGWKDSFDGINFVDGRLAEAPIALCEVQGYVYSAYLARAHFAREAGDDALCERWAQRAADLRAAFNERFWLPDRGWYAVGLDRDKRPIDALASNMGHCLWTGIVDEDKAEAVAAHLLGPDLFSGWGVRTLAQSMGAYNPLSYHNGSVWPHDNAIVAAGLVRYGFVDEAQRIAAGMLEAAEAFGGRLPELFCGFDRAEFDQPVPFPTSCSPQAWASAAPLHLLRSLLRFNPSVPRGEIHLAPAVPRAYLPLQLDNVALAGTRVSLSVTSDGFDIDGLPASVVVRGPRRATTDLLPGAPTG
jgi:glycogen debranching enzyme